MWDEIGRCSDYSQVATFDIGLSPTDWKAKFIWDCTVVKIILLICEKSSAFPRSHAAHVCSSVHTMTTFCF